MKSRDSLASAQARLRAKFAPQRRSRGRPHLELDPEAVYCMAVQGYSARAIARYLVCDPGTILRRFSLQLKCAREYRRRWAWLDADHVLGWLAKKQPNYLLALLQEADSDDFLAWLQEQEEDS